MKQIYFIVLLIGVCVASFLVCLDAVIIILKMILGGV